MSTELLQKLVYGLSIGDKSGDLYGKLWPTFPGAKFFHKGYLAHFCRSATKFGRGVWPIETYFPNFVNFGPEVP